MNINEIQKSINEEAERISKLPMPPLRVRHTVKGKVRNLYLRARHFAGRCYRFARRKLGALKRRLFK